MAIRRSQSASRNSSQSQAKQSRRNGARSRVRQMLSEQLEQRQLFAVGPSLIGIQPNNSDLLVDGAVRNTSPRELVFRFDESQVINANTLDGIRITRSGGDGSFGFATTTSDFGSNGGVEIQLTASSKGTTPTVRVTRADLGTGVSPSFTYSSSTGELTIRLNSNVGTPTTAAQLVAAMNVSPVAAPIVTAKVTAGFADTAIGSNAITYSPIKLTSTGDIQVTPGQVLVGAAPKQNEVTFRFASLLPNDQYRIEVFGYDDPVEGVVGLRNTTPQGQVGDLFIPTSSNTRKDTINFRLDLGPKVVSVVPQPVVRNTSGQLTQQRDTVVVYFDESKLFVENDSLGQPTARSAENPAFYQLILTEDTVRNTDDRYFVPQTAKYNAATNSVTLKFAQDIDLLPGSAAGQNTFRLRVGTRESAPITPTFSEAAATAISDFNTDGGATFRFVSQVLGKAGSGIDIVVINSGTLTPIDPPLISVSGKVISIDLGRDNVTANELLLALRGNSLASALVSVTLEPGSDPNTILDAPINYSPISVVGLGSSFDTASNLGVIGSVNVAQTSLVLSSEIQPVDYTLDLPGANNDPGSRQLPTQNGADFGDTFEDHINALFGADSISGVSTIYYNFKTVYATDALNNPLTNAITEKQKNRTREAFQTWSNHLGVQFIETTDLGITVALGSTTALGNGSNVLQTGFNVGVRIDPQFQSSLVVLGTARQWSDNYGEDWFRASLTGIGIALGLEKAGDLPIGQLMALSTNFINQGRPDVTPTTEPVFPGSFDVLHGQYVLRPDSNDVQLYRFEVKFDEPNQVGEFVAETQAERLQTSSSLNTLLHLYKQVQATASSNMSAGGNLLVEFEAMKPGLLGNNLQIIVTQSERTSGDNVLVSTSDNAVHVDLNSQPGSLTTVDQFIKAINENPEASALVKVKLKSGSTSTVLGGLPITYSPITLQGGEVKLIAQNDDYFSEDSLIKMSLDSGVYFVGVSASGNNNYDAVIENTGYGGRSQGRYDLRMTFRAEVDSGNAIRNSDGQFPGDTQVVFDGDGDGNPAGVYNFWFQTAPLNRTIEFNAGAVPELEGKIVTLTAANGTVRRFEFDSNNSVSVGNIRVPYTLADGPGRLADVLATQIRSRPELGISAVANGSQIVLSGERSISLALGLDIITIHGRTIFVDKSASPNADGSLTKPFNNIAGVGVPNAFAIAQPGDIVRIVGNGGSDSNVATITNNLAYEFGVDLINGVPLSDGAQMEIPKGVTTMVDAGAIFKFNRSYVGVGSNNLGVDRSGGTLQILGTPGLTDANGNLLKNTDGSIVGGSVYFTSWQDETIGADTYAPRTTPSKGDWGGILYRNDVDASAGRRNLEDEGIFLNYVNHADMRYGGGGNVFIDSIQQVVNPVQMIDLRPTVTYNKISQSAGAAMSGAPNSFVETNFQEPKFQASGAFTSDYDRVGPEIHHNSLVDNSLNALFVKVDTPVADSIRKLTTNARFDDIDIVHVINENLIISGTPGGSIIDTTVPQGSLIALQAAAGGKLLPGTYNYKISFVDAFGYETMASDVSSNVSTGTGQTAIRLLGLPLATGEYVARRIYRSDASGGGVYSLVAQIDAKATEYLDIGANAGGTLVRDRANVTAVTMVAVAGGTLAVGNYNYRVVMVDASNRESVASNATASVTTTAASPGVPANRAVQLTNLPALQAGYSKVRLYRSSVGSVGPYTLVAELSGNSYLDTGSILQNSSGNAVRLPAEALGSVRPRLDASLVVDPGTVVKLEGSRIEVEQGANLIAEGTDGAPVIFTSKLDDRYGAGGAFDTNNDSTTTTPAARDWSGIYVAAGANVSLDNAVVAYAGGISKIEGTFKAFNPVEIQGGSGRITNTTFEFNEDGIGGQGPVNRLGRLDNRAATIFVRGSQPILVGNVFRSNQGSAINIDANSLTAELLPDIGRSTGSVDRLSQYDSNRGPLVRGNRMENNEINGMEVRHAPLTVESVWDDTDVVHVLFGTISVTNLHHVGGIRLQSAPDESLVVKIRGYGSNFDDYAGAGFTATGFDANIVDRVGGTLQVIGYPGFPVVLTSFNDDSVGAGLQPDGTPQTDTNNDGIDSVPRPADWRGLLLDQYSNDRNVATVMELEKANAVAPGSNSTTVVAQFIGELASKPETSDENYRLGFIANGVLSEPTDVDVYSFTAEAGTEVWLDVDHTTQSLDTMIELLNSSGQLLARSNNSVDETLDSSLITRDPGVISTLINPLNNTLLAHRTNADGSFKEPGTVNPRDAGMRVVLPGTAGARTNYYFRIRSASTNPDNFSAGLTSGTYSVQVRIRSEQEFAGSIVQYADIRYAMNGVHLKGLPSNSPLIGEAQEAEAATGNSYSNNGTTSLTNPWGVKSQYVGNIVQTNKATLSIGGNLSASTDLDFYRFDVGFGNVAGGSTDTAPIVFDMDYADGLNRADTSLSVFQVFGNAFQLVYYAEDSSVAEDRGNVLDLAKGSVGSKDPYIGPVDLSEGTYEVAITSAGRQPAALLGATRVPVAQVLDQAIVGTFAGIGSEVVSNSFDISGMSALNVPKIYFDGSFFGTVNLFLQDSTGTRIPVQANVAVSGSQSIVTISAATLASAVTSLQDLTNVSLVFSGATTGSIGNLFVGTAERGERIVNAAFDNSFVSKTVSPTTIQTGAYQLEMRQASRAITLADGAFPRFTDAITLVAPAGSALISGDVFKLRDAGAEVVFEFTQNGTVTPGHIAVQFTSADSAAVIAQRIRDAINNPGVQSRIKVSAASRGGATSGLTGDAQINLFGSASGEFGKVSVIVHSGYGDENTARDQGQVLVRDNFIRYSRDYGVWTEPGERIQDSRETLEEIAPEVAGTDAISDIPNLVRSTTGAVRNLTEPNNTLLGGFNPGIVISNNVLESGGLGGVHVSGENPIWMITPRIIPGVRNADPLTGDAGTGSSTNPFDHFGSFIDDRDLLYIDSGRTRVKFEFEDIAGAGTGNPTFGSGIEQGNGWDDDAVPMYYREDGGAQYYRLPNTSPGYSALEVLQSMRDSIFGSILVTNGTTQRIKATVAPSLLGPLGGTVSIINSAGYVNFFNRAALYLEGVSNLNWVDRNGGGNPFDIRRVDIANDSQPFARVVNNTVYGNDGRATFNSGAATQEPNETISQAIETWQGTAHNPISYTGTGVINAFDVDVFKFKAEVGERAMINLDVTGSTLNPVMRIYDSAGRPQKLTAAGGLVTELAGASLDFTSTKSGVYYVAVSSQGNSDYDPLSLAGREAGSTTGTYAIDLMVLHPQQFTITAQDSSQYANGDTFRIYQVSNLPNGTNFRTFEFTTTGAVSAVGNVPIQFDATYRAPDMARAIAGAITGPNVANIPLPNAQTLPNGAFGTASPLAPVSAKALGGISGVEAGLTLFPRRADGVFPTHSSLGIGHDRRLSGQLSNTSIGDGTTERFVVVSNAAYIDSNGGVVLVDPDINANNNLDQLLPETGILVTAGASPTLMNNVFVNVQTPIVDEETRVTNPGNAFANRNPAPFGSNNTDVHPKTNQVIVGGSVYQFVEPAVARNRLGNGIENGPANLPNTGLDFNITLPNTHKTFVDAQASQFLPAKGSRIIDSSLDSLEEREAFRTIKQAAGIAISPVVAPTRDAYGQLRVDDPTVAPPNGQGANVFKDRGALERADFDGPTAVAVAPQDNDARNVDQDKAVSIIELADGVYPEFRIKLVDGIGTGVDDTTVAGSSTTLRLPGSAVTVFENGKLLKEGFDYTFSYDTTTNEVTLTPLAGIWKNDRVYEISINNKDRFVLYAPAGDQVSDGDSFTINDTNGGTVHFEFDSGYRLQVPQGLSLLVPLAGGATGGVADGDRFSITINGTTTTFEFDRNGNFLAGNRSIAFQLGASQDEIRSLVFQALSSSGLAISPRLVGTDRIFIGAERGTELNTNFTALDQPTTTLALKMPALGPRPGGVTEGQTFQVSDGRRIVTFEYDTDGNVTAGNTAIDFASATTVAELTQATLAGLQNSVLNINPVQISDNLIHLGLGTNGDAAIISSNVSIVGVARTVNSGETFTITTSLGTKTFEMTRTGSVTVPTNIGITYAINDTQDEVGTRVAQAIRDAGLGLEPVHVADGNVTIGGVVSDIVNVASAPSLGLFGVPGVQSNIQLEVFGSLIMKVPSRGASGIVEGSTFTLSNNGRTIVFEMDANGFVTPGRVAVRYTTQNTATEIATVIAQAINLQSFGIQATANTAGEVRLGQIQDSQLNVGNTGFAVSRGVVNDGETFVISNGTQTVTFEFDNVDLGNGFSSTNSPILISSTSSPDSVVQSMKAVIEGSVLGLTTTLLAGGKIQLNATPTYTVNATLSPSLIKTGVAGGAQAVKFLEGSSFTGEDMVDSIIRAINNAPNSSLIATSRGGNTLFVENATFISTNMDSFFLRGVVDVAGNLLKPNRINNDTAFTILMPGTQLDFGDAPDPFENTNGRYPTLRSSDGARHVDSGIALLGSAASAERDGQSSPDALSDVDDGVQFGTNFQILNMFNRFIQTPITVTLSSPGYVDGWIDWNADGDWDDPGEQVFTSEEFSKDLLTRTFMVSVPVTAPEPASVISTFARFRSSTTGGLTPRGLATDGEVEDYQVKVAPGTPPTAVDDVYSVNEDGNLQTSDANGQSTPNFPIDDGVAGNDVDPDSTALGVVLLQGPTHASFFKLESNGTFEYIPTANYFGIDTFVYRVNDGTLNSNNLGTVTINVQEVNDAPVPVNDILNTSEDTALTINQSQLLLNDSAGANEDTQTMNVTGVQSVTPNGGSVLLVNGVVTYTPAPNFHGTDTFTYTVTDNGTTGGVSAPRSATAIVTINVAEVNDAPVVPGASTSTTEDDAVSINGTSLLVGALAGPADEQVWQSVRVTRVDSQSTNGGTVAWNTTTNTILYTPKLNFAGVDTFVYDVVDFSTDANRVLTSPRTTSGTVTINVTNTNDDPFVKQTLGTRTLAEDQAASVIDLRQVFDDADLLANDQLTFQIISNSNLTLVSPTISGNQLTLQPLLNQNGQARIVVEASDLAGRTVRDTLTLNVTPVNDAPFIVAPLADIVVNKNATVPSISLSPSRFSDPDIANGDFLTYRVVSNTNSLLVTPTISGTSLNLSLLNNQFGTAVITVSATDSQGLTVADEFTLTVNNVNQAPVGTPDTYNVPQGTLLSVGTSNGVLVNDSDPEGDAIRAEIVSNPSFATQFTFNSNGSFTYLHNGASRQTDSFVYRVFDGQLRSANVTVTINIDAPPPPSHQNPSNRLDVNADGRITPIDALLVINLLNDPTRPRDVRLLPAPPAYFDVDGSGLVTAGDALLVINHLNANSGGGEGEGGIGSLLAPMVFDVSRSMDNQSVGMQNVPEAVYGPLMPEGEAGLLGEPDASQWIDLSWMDHCASHSGSSQAEDIALSELLDEAGLS